MNALWHKWAGRYAALSAREQMLIAVAALAIVYFLMQAVWVDPAAKRVAAMRAQMVGQETELTALEAQIANIKAQLHDPDEANRKLLAELQAQLSGVEGEIGNLDDKLVPPQRMGKVLQTVLSRHRSLALVSLRSLAPEPLLVVPEEKAVPEKSAVATRRENIYRHGIEIRVLGTYADLLAYVAELERSPQRLLWGGMSLKVTAYPRSELTLTVYTLSRELDWLAV
ncbi:MAG: type II secretion system protein M [Gammaproteobacteria bacterium]|nr:type II secretion system protein M [Gammaproteobacteria bacterium]MBU1416507.1 type II secretion system protein M [Gammaproteobacteria bacterium]